MMQSMKSPTKRRRSKLKWAFLVTSIIIAAAMLGTLFGSLWFHINYHIEFTVAIVRGCVTLTPDPWILRGPVYLKFGSAYPSWHWLPGGNSVDQYWYLPLWCPLLLSVLATVWLFYRDRRRLPGYCTQCGYDLTGNVSGRCPECGIDVADRVVEDVKTE